VFVRLTGCPLRCVWCDTEHAFFGGERLRAIDVVNAVLCFGVDVVEVTGGEPLAQPSCISLLQGLVLHQRTVQLETSGSICIQKVPREVRVIMDLKCPGSGEVEKNNYGNVQSLLRTDEVKFVVSHREDFLWAANQVRELGLADRVNCVLMSPVFGKCDPRELVEWILEDRTRGARMQIQVHKTIWPPDTRGV
jgi:7-carboxy-7-deazaguanine synthase